MNTSKLPTTLKQSHSAANQASAYPTSHNGSPTVTESSSLKNTEQRSAAVTVVLSGILTETHPAPRWGINE